MMWCCGRKREVSILCIGEMLCKIWEWYILVEGVEIVREVVSFFLDGVVVDICCFDEVVVFVGFIVVDVVVWEGICSFVGDISEGVCEVEVID